MRFLWHADSDSLTPFILASSLILIISAFFVPAAAIMYIQDLLFFSYDHLSFIRPSAAYIGFGLGMIWISIIMLSFLFTKMYSEKRERTYKLTGLHLTFLALAVPVFVFSVCHYAYLDEQGVHDNSFWSLSEDSIAWDDVEEVTRLVEEDSKRVISYTFSKSDTSITIPYDTQDYHTNQTISRAVDEYNWDITDILADTGSESSTFGD